MNMPPTGSMAYKEGVDLIPHAAITVEDAAMLRRMAERGLHIEVHLTMEGESRGMPGMGLNVESDRYFW